MLDDARALVSSCNLLLQQNNAIVTACDAAAANIATQAIQRMLAAVRVNHLSHAENLSQLVVGFGGKHPHSAVPVPTTSPVQPAPQNNERAFLLNLRERVDSMRHAYQIALGQSELHPIARSVLMGNRTEVERQLVALDGLRETK